MHVSILVVLTVVFHASLGLASEDASPYQFTGATGACGSQGPWTQQALNKTAELRSILSKLKDDPNCKQHAQATQANLERIQHSLEEVNKEKELIYRQGKMSKEVSSLRMFLVGDGSNRNQIMSSILPKMVMAERAKGGDAIFSMGNPTAGSNDNRSLSARVATASAQSLEIFNETIDYLPRLKECLVRPDDSLQMAASAVQFLSALGSDGNNANSLGFARTLSKLATYMRESKFASALTELNKTDFLASLTCMIEMTSENYCATRDAHILLDEMTQANQIKKNERGELSLTSDQTQFAADGKMSPLAGYYLLSQNIPVVTEWLQMVQLGATPRTASDANQKNEPITQMADFQKKVNSLEATINSGMENIRAIKTMEEKRNAVLHLILEINSEISNFAGKQGDDGSKTVNFFTYSVSTMDLAFFLIGAVTPDEVKGTGGMVAQSAQTYMQANYKPGGKLATFFSDPDELANRVAGNLKLLMEKATASAVTYYNRWFIVDRVRITNASLLGVNYSVKDSLRNTVTYIDSLIKRVQRYSPDDMSIVPLLVETRGHVTAVLQRFTNLEMFAKRAKEEGLSPEQTSEQARKLSEELIAETYNQFNVMLVKSGWLAARMGDFVLSDFQLMKRAGVDFNPYLDMVYTASGRTLTDEIINMSASGPAAVNSDINQAMHLGKRNLMAIEMALSDSYLMQIASLEQTIKGMRSTNAVALYKTAHPEESALLPDTDPIPGQSPVSNNIVMRIAEGIWKGPLAGFGDLSRPWNSIARTFNAIWDGPTPVASETEFGAAAYVKSQLCVQTLAFTNLKPFWPLCRDVELVSPFMNAKFGVSPLKDSFRAIYNVQYKTKAWEDAETNPALNHSKRICAFRDYNRRNLVLYLTKNQF